MKENVSMCRQDSEVLAMKLSSGDLSGVQMTGQCIDRIYKNGVLIDEIRGHNLVVNSFVRLVMCLLKQEDGYSNSLYWAVGGGASSWDSNPANPSVGDTRLTSELGRRAIDKDNIVFLNSDHEESSVPTNIIRITHTFEAEDCNGVWREFAIFGGNATSEKDTGIMINKRHHAILTKTNEMSVKRIMIFTLNLV